MDDGNADVYFVENRNADRVSGLRPTVVHHSSRQPHYVPPAAAGVGPRVTYASPATYAGPAQLMAPQWFLGGNQPVYFPPSPWGWGGQPGTLGGLFSGLNNVNIGSLVEMIGQGFAAIRSLPVPPTASGEGSTDVANLTLYQQALAEHGKTDEQIRTAVHILGKLLGA